MATEVWASAVEAGRIFQGSPLTSKGASRLLTHGRAHVSCVVVVLCILFTVGSAQGNWWDDTGNHQSIDAQPQAHQFYAECYVGDLCPVHLQAFIKLPDRSKVTLEVNIEERFVVSDVILEIQDLTHEYMGDLQIEVNHDNRKVILNNQRRGIEGAGRELEGTYVFRDDGATSMFKFRGSDYHVPGGTYSCDREYSTMNFDEAFVGRESYGLWVVSMEDFLKRDEGSMDMFKLTLIDEEGQSHDYYSTYDGYIRGLLSPPGCGTLYQVNDDGTKGAEIAGSHIQVNSDSGQDLIFISNQPGNCTFPFDMEVHGLASTPADAIMETRCGNGLKEGRVDRVGVDDPVPAEGCDDNNIASGDGCSNRCKVEDGWQCENADGPDRPTVCDFCGNGLVKLDEECDDGNTVAGDGCSDCRVDTGWLCVKGNDGQSRCSICGDGRVDGAEECDDRNSRDGDGCSSSCAVEEGWTCGGNPSTCARCGDGKVGDNEECDDGNDIHGDGCSSCRVDEHHVCVESNGRSICSLCGDGVVDWPEDCDDGNYSDGDGCDSHCDVEAGYHCSEAVGGESVCSACGNSELDGTEECDDGNADDGDGCSSHCEVEENWTCDSQGRSCVRCGDGHVAVDVEVCDDGNNDNGDGCTSSCHLEGGWTCVESDATGTSMCGRCGDGVLQALEECDVGVSGSEGCDDKCEILSGYTCVGSPSVCHMTCGDGEWSPLIEQCDDANLVTGDGCNDHCRVEEGWVVGEDGGLETLCGDKLVKGEEECDDGNTHGGDGCDRRCRLEKGWLCSTNASAWTECTTCGNGVVDYAESCDDANSVDGDGCSSACSVEEGFQCETVTTDCLVASNATALFSPQPHPSLTNTPNDPSSVDDEGPPACDTISTASPASDTCARHLGLSGTFSGYSVCFKSHAPECIMGDEEGWRWMGLEHSAVDNTGDSTGDSGGDSTGDNTGDITGDSTGDSTGDNTGDNTGDSTGGGDKDGQHHGDGSEGDDAGGGSGSSVVGGVVVRQMWQWSCRWNEVRGSAVCLRETVSIAERCGDGHVGEGETCDDGNAFVGDGCSGECVVEHGFDCFVPTNTNEGSPGTSNGPSVCAPIASGALAHDPRDWSVAYAAAVTFGVICCCLPLCFFLKRRSEEHKKHNRDKDKHLLPLSERRTVTRSATKEDLLKIAKGRPSPKQLAAAERRVAEQRDRDEERSRAKKAKAAASSSTKEGSATVSHEAELLVISRADHNELPLLKASRETEVRLYSSALSRSDLSTATPKGEGASLMRHRQGEGDGADPRKSRNTLLDAAMEQSMVVEELMGGTDRERTKQEQLERQRELDMKREKLIQAKEKSAKRRLEEAERRKKGQLLVQAREQEIRDEMELKALRRQEEMEAQELISRAHQQEQSRLQGDGGDTLLLLSSRKERIPLRSSSRSRSPSRRGVKGSNCGICDKTFKFWRPQKVCYRCKRDICSSCSISNFVSTTLGISTPERMCCECIDKLSRHMGVAAGAFGSPVASPSRRSGSPPRSPKFGGGLHNIVRGEGGDASWPSRGRNVSTDSPLASTPNPPLFQPHTSATKEHNNKDNNNDNSNSNSTTNNNSSNANRSTLWTQPPPGRGRGRTSRRGDSSGSFSPVRKRSSSPTSSPQRKPWASPSRAPGIPPVSATFPSLPQPASPEIAFYATAKKFQREGVGTNSPTSVPKDTSLEGFVTSYRPLSMVKKEEEELLRQKRQSAEVRSQRQRKERHPPQHTATTTPTTSADVPANGTPPPRPSPRPGYTPKTASGTIGTTRRGSPSRSRVRSASPASTLRARRLYFDQETLLRRSGSIHRVKDRTYVEPQGGAEEEKDEAPAPVAVLQDVEGEVHRLQDLVKAVEDGRQAVQLLREERDRLEQLVVQDAKTVAYLADKKDEITDQIHRVNSEVDLIKSTIDHSRNTVSKLLFDESLLQTPLFGATVKPLPRSTSPTGPPEEGGDKLEASLDHLKHSAQSLQTDVAILNQSAVLTRKVTSTDANTSTASASHVVECDHCHHPVSLNSSFVSPSVTDSSQQLTPLQRQHRKEPPITMSSTKDLDELKTEWNAKVKSLRERIASIQSTSPPHGASAGASGSKLTAPNSHSQSHTQLQSSRESTPTFHFDDKLDVLESGGSDRSATADVYDAIASEIEKLPDDIKFRL